MTDGTTVMGSARAGGWRKVAIALALAAAALVSAACGGNSGGTHGNSGGSPSSTTAKSGFGY